MRAQFFSMGMLAVMLAAGGCGDNDNSGGTPLVYVNGARRPGTACPSGTTEAYRDGNLIVCHGCAMDADCGGLRRCSTQCGPGCENDTGGCCPVRACVEPVR